MSDAQDALGLGSSALAKAIPASKSFLSAPRSGPIYGTTGSPFVTVSSVTIPANTVKGGDLIDIHGLLAKYQPFNAGTSIRVKIGSVTVLQAALAAPVASFPLKATLSVSSDRKWAHCQYVNTFNIPGPTTSSTLNQFIVGGSAPSNIGARTSSTQVAFVSYSDPPTTETIIVDFSQPVVISFDIQVLNGDVAEYLYSNVEIRRSQDTPLSYANSKAISIWGDSLTEGTGSSPVSSVPQDYPAQLRRLLVGYPVDPRGLGGQISSQIVSRLLDDTICGKYWKCIVWAGTNDINTDGPTWWNSVYPYLDKVIAFRDNQTKPIFVNLYPRAGWATNSAYYTAMQYVNTQMLSRYGSSVICDMFSALATAGGQVPLNLFSAVAATTGSITSGTNTLTVASATGIAIGQYVISPGSTAISDGSIGSAPTVTNVSGTTITLSQNASGTLSNAAVNFIGAGEVHLNNTGYATVASTLNTKITALGW